MLSFVIIDLTLFINCVPILKILCCLWPVGMCVSKRRRKKLRVMFVLTFLLRVKPNDIALFIPLTKKAHENHMCFTCDSHVFTCDSHVLPCDSHVISCDSHVIFMMYHVIHM